MKIKSADIRKTISSIYPGMQFIVLTDEQWDLPSIDDIKKTPVFSKYLRYLPYVFECEEISLSFVSDLRKFRASGMIENNVPDSDRLNWPVGFVWGTKYRGRNLNHWWNVAFTKEGMFFIEKQTDEIWKPRKDSDDIHFLWM